MTEAARNMQDPAASAHFTLVDHMSFAHLGDRRCATRCASVCLSQGVAGYGFACCCCRSLRVPPLLRHFSVRETSSTLETVVKDHDLWPCLAALHQEGVGASTILASDNCFAMRQTASRCLSQVNVTKKQIGKQHCTAAVVGICRCVPHSLEIRPERWMRALLARAITQHRFFVRHGRCERSISFSPALLSPCVRAFCDICLSTARDAACSQQL